MGLEDLLAQLDSRPDRRGREFERICAWYLRTAPEYNGQFRHVWLWDEWPGRWAADAGIDLVAETRAGDVWAIQAKAYDPAYTIKKADVNSFLSESGRSEFAYRLLIATTDLIGPNARRTLAGQEKPAGLLLRSRLAITEVEWPESPSELVPLRPVPKRPFPYQQEAVDAVVNGFNASGRGQLLVASGTGKTLTSCFIASALSARRVLVLIPSLSLLAQTLREWALAMDIEYLAVCSDATVIGTDLDSVVANTSEVGFPVTTDPSVIARFMCRDGELPLVVFATYQSSERISEAHAIGCPAFDLIVADEAHRCAGPEAGIFATVLDASKIKAQKRLFMTATPRFFTERVRREAREADWEVASMDDKRLFGPVLHRLPFGEAIARGLLSDYQVAIIGVSDSTYREYAQRGIFVTVDGKTVTDARTLASQIGLLRALASYNLRRVVTFHSRIRNASHFASSLVDVYRWVPDDRRPAGRLWAAHVSGEMTSGQRDNRLNRLRAITDGERGVLTNARCLAEGVDVPTLDGVAFVEPRKSQTDIVQAVGRAIRKAADKSLGTIVIPVFIDEGVDPEEALEASEFKRVWDVVKALRAHDDVLAEELDELRRALGRRRTTDRRPSKIFLDLPVSVGDSFARAFDSKLVVKTTPQWASWFSLLQEYTAREGEARPRLSHVEAGYPLGEWVNRQRSRYAIGKLSAEQVGRLKSLPGWTWSGQDSAWEDRFGSLRRFAKREGHALVPAEYIDEDGFRLGRWVREQRDAKVKHPERLANGRGARLEAVPGWVWATGRRAPRKSWEESFSNLQKYVAREGDALVPPSHIESGQRLGMWVVAQRSAYRYRLPRLTPERASRLEALPGWVWATTDRQVTTRDWEESFSNLEQYVAREGHARVPHSHIENDHHLGTWVVAQRVAYKNRNARMTPVRVARLEALPGWVWVVGPRRPSERRLNTRSWEEHYSTLLQYVAREGNARVPHTHVENDQSLGAWVRSQRTAYKNRTAAMTSERASLLEALPGWFWSARTSPSPGWEGHYRCLERFVARTGHARVPVSHVEGDKKLGIWVGNQRAEYRRGVASMTPERIARLEAVPGWAWNPGPSGNRGPSGGSAWEHGLSRLDSFVQREGHARVPRGHVDADGYRLGQWVYEQRRLARRGKLRDERRERLEALPGWLWTVRASAAERARVGGG